MLNTIAEVSVKLIDYVGVVRSFYADLLSTNAEARA